MDFQPGFKADDTFTGQIGQRRRVLSEAGPRIWDRQLRCWVLAEVPTPEVCVAEPGETFFPKKTGSRRFWKVVSEGQVFWRFAAETFEEALAEKRRLCEGAGYKSGWARLVEDRT